MTTANAKAAQTSTGGNLKSIQRTKAALHAKARKLGLNVHPTGEVLHQKVSDAAPMNFVWGCAFGHGLAIDAVHAIRLNAELGYSPEEGVQNLLRDAFKNLDSSPTLNGLDRRGLAVGAIYTIAALAAQAIQGADALAEAERLRAEAVELATAADIEQSQRMKARAMAKPATEKFHEVAA
ncbi:MAG: hypothetical protein WBJ45_05595 [Limnohabitans sp.]|uniref:hypothetical protein n=1 Tax=Limnohabitans sp. TaxID=1907725 RepID=UPI003BB1091C